MIQFSQEEYIVDESADYAIFKVIISGQRYLPILFNYKVFVSSTKFQPYPGVYSILCWYSTLILCIQILF